MLIALVVAAAVPLAAQNVSDQRFEVASIKPAAPDVHVFTIGFQAGGRYIATGQSVLDLIRNAFINPGPPPARLRPEQIIDAPTWGATARYDIEARLPSELANQRFSLVSGAVFVRRLLEDRLHLKTHEDTRELPVFALVLAKNDGTLGPKLHKSDVDCAALRRASGNTSFSIGPPTDATLAPCNVAFEPGAAQGSAMPLNMLATFLQTAVGNAEVVDRTGLTGVYDFDVRYSFEASNPRPNASGAAPEPDGVSVFTAVQEQLGLKLEPRKEPRRVIVIDHIEKPAED